MRTSRLALPEFHHGYAAHRLLVVDFCPLAWEKRNTNDFFFFFLALWAPQAECCTCLYWREGRHLWRLIENDSNSHQNSFPTSSGLNCTVKLKQYVFKWRCTFNTRQTVMCCLSVFFFFLHEPQIITASLSKPDLDVSINPSDPEGCTSTFLLGCWFSLSKQVFLSYASFLVSSWDTAEWTRVYDGSRQRGS